jgi:hypothetical protein
VLVLWMDKQDWQTYSSFYKMGEKIQINEIRDQKGHDYNRCHQNPNDHYGLLRIQFMLENWFQQHIKISDTMIYLVLLLENKNGSTYAN